MKIFKLTTSVLVTLLASHMMLSTPAFAFSGTTNIPGTGDSQSLMRAIARTFEAKNPKAHINIPNSIGSSGGIKMLINGKTEMARIARPLLEEEAAHNFTVLTFARSPVVFSVNSHASKLKNLSTEQIVGIYNGSISEWSNFGIDLGKIYPLMREQGDSSLIILNKLIPGFSHIKSKALKILYTTPELVQTLQRYKRTIGFSAMSAVLETDLQILAVNNIYPSLQNVQNGKYKYVTPLSVVYKSEPIGLNKAFLDFLFSQEGIKITIEHGAIPVTK